MRSTILLFTALFLFVLSGNGLAATYDVGPGQTYTELGQVDWLNLGAGDTVRIHYRTEPYREKIGLHGRGTEEAPITIIGVKGPAGELPVLSGENAVTDSQFNGFFSAQWDEFLGVFVIKRASEDAWGYKPGYLHFENLKIVGAKPGNSYTDMTGTATANYADGAAAIWAVLAEHLVIKNCEITDNGNGLFVLSKSNTEEETSRDILIEGNYIHDNGNVGRDREHNIYTQAAGAVFQYNRIGTLRPGALGSSLKDRSSGTVIRYNWIEASARALDLVDPEDSAAILTVEPDFHQTYVYGNVLLNDNIAKAVDGRAICTSLVHYGGDTGTTDDYRKGTLYFYHNTVVVKSTEWRHRFFDLSTNDETVDIRNNIFYVQAGTTEINLMRFYGVANLEGMNWINTGWRNGDDSFAGNGGTVNQNGSLITGTDPGFTDGSQDDYTLALSSPCLDQGAVLPSTITTGHDLLLEYVLHRTYRNKVAGGAGFDLGAFEQCGPCGCGRLLPANTWLMTAPSCTPSPAGISDQYGTDLGGTYGTDWISFKWDTAPQSYIQQTGTDPLELGIGNWNYSVNAGTLSLSGTAAPTEDCSIYGWSAQTCHAINLTPSSGSDIWQLVGHPFPYTVDWADVRVAASTNGGATWNTYTPSEAETANLMLKTWWRYTGSAYDSYDDSTLGMIGVLQPQEAIWLRILSGSNGLSAGNFKLLIPAN